MLFANDGAVQVTARGQQGIDRRIKPQLDLFAREDQHGVEITENSHDRRIGQVVGRHVKRLQGRDRSAFFGTDPLLKITDLGSQRRLISGFRWNAPQKGRYLRPGLDEPVHVIDKKKDILVLVLQMFSQGHPGQRDLKARARRLIHLPEGHHDLICNLLFLHFEI